MGFVDGIWKTVVDAKVYFDGSSLKNGSAVNAEPSSWIETQGRGLMWINSRYRAPQFVKPYVKTDNNDVADAEAICEAVS